MVDATLNLSHVNVVILLALLSLLALVSPVKSLAIEPPNYSRSAYLGPPSETCLYCQSGRTSTDVVVTTVSVTSIVYEDLPPCLLHGPPCSDFSCHVPSPRPTLLPSSPGPDPDNGPYPGPCQSPNDMPLLLRPSTSTSLQIQTVYTTVFGYSNIQPLPCELPHTPLAPASVVVVTTTTATVYIEQPLPLPSSASTSPPYQQHYYANASQPYAFPSADTAPVLLSSLVYDVALPSPQPKYLASSAPLEPAPQPQQPCPQGEVCPEQWNGWPRTGDKVDVTTWQTTENTTEWIPVRYSWRWDQESQSQPQSQPQQQSQAQPLSPPSTPMPQVLPSPPFVGGESYDYAGNYAEQLPALSPGDQEYPSPAPQVATRLAYSYNGYEPLIPISPVAVHLPSLPAVPAVPPVPPIPQLSPVRTPAYYAPAPVPQNHVGSPASNANASGYAYQQGSYPNTQYNRGPKLPTAYQPQSQPQQPSQLAAAAQPPPPAPSYPYPYYRNTLMSSRDAKSLSQQLERGTNQPSGKERDQRKRRKVLNTRAENKPYEFAQESYKSQEEDNKFGVYVEVTPDGISEKDRDKYVEKQSPTLLGKRYHGRKRHAAGEARFTGSQAPKRPWYSSGRPNMSMSAISSDDRDTFRPPYGGGSSRFRPPASQFAMEALSCPKSDGAVYAGYKVFCNKELHGYHIRSDTSRTFKLCIEKCHGHADCLGVNYRPTGLYDVGECHLKAGYGPHQKRAGIWSAKIDIPPSPPLVNCPLDNYKRFIGGSGYVFEIRCGMEHHGGEMYNGIHPVEHQEECLAICESRQDCQSITFVEGKCYLHDWRASLHPNPDAWTARIVQESSKSDYYEAKSQVEVYGAANEAATLYYTNQTSLMARSEGKDNITMPANSTSTSLKKVKRDGKAERQQQPQQQQHRPASNPTVPAQRSCQYWLAPYPLGNFDGPCDPWDIDRCDYCNQCGCDAREYMRCQQCWPIGSYSSPLQPPALPPPPPVAAAPAPPPAANYLRQSPASVGSSGPQVQAPPPPPPAPPVPQQQQQQQPYWNGQQAQQPAPYSHPHSHNHNQQQQQPPLQQMPQQPPPQPMPQYQPNSPPAQFGQYPQPYQPYAPPPYPQPQYQQPAPQPPQYYPPQGPSPGQPQSNGYSQVNGIPNIPGVPAGVPGVWGTSQPPQGGVQTPGVTVVQLQFRKRHEEEDNG